MKARVDRLTPEECAVAVELFGSQLQAALALRIPRSTFCSWLDPQHHRQKSREWYRQNTTEEDRAQKREYKRKQYWENPEKYRAISSDRYYAQDAVQRGRRRLRARRWDALQRMEKRTKQRMEEKSTSG